MTENRLAQRSSRARILWGAVGAVLLISLPVVPWVARGMTQRHIENGVKAAGGRISYGRYLLESGDDFRDDKANNSNWKRDFFGDAFVEKLTFISLQKPLEKKGLLRHFSRLHDLSVLEAPHTNLENSDLASLGDCSSLRKLTLDHTLVTGDGLSTLTKLPKLTTLSLQGLSIDDASVESLAGASKLRRLYLADTHVGDAGVAKLVGLKGLLGIGLEGTRITDEAIAQLAELPILSELRLSRTSVSNVALPLLAKLSHLTAIYLAETDVTLEGLTWLPACSALETVDLQKGSKINDGIIEILVQMPKLVQVNLSNTGCTPAAIEELRSRKKGLTVQYE